jgi:hypothetical protein
MADERRVVVRLILNGAEAVAVDGAGVFTGLDNARAAHGSAFRCTRELLAQCSDH